MQHPGRSSMKSTGHDQSARWRDASVWSFSLLLFVAAYICVLLYWEDFAYSDNSIFTLYLTRGVTVHPLIWPGQGRFFPLGYQEFNLIRHFATTIIGYQMVPIAELIAVCCLLMVIDDELSVGKRAALAAVILIFPGMMISYGGLIYTERNVIVCLLGMVLCVKQFATTQSIKWGLAGLLCAQIMIYYKETAFLLLIGFAGSRLTCRYVSDHQFYKKPGLFNAGLLDACFALLALIYLSYYILIMLPHPSLRYASDAKLPWLSALTAYIRIDILAFVFMAATVWRLIAIARGKSSPSLMWDCLAIGGVLYCMAFLCLRIFAVYYLAPVDVIGILYLGRLILLSPKRHAVRWKVASATVTAVILLQAVAVSCFRIYERKNVIHGKVEIAEVIKEQYSSSGMGSGKLFFPFAKPYRIMEFASYLSYRGLPVEGVVSGDDRGGVIRLTAESVAEDGPCVGYRPVICHSSAGPSAGDLVVVLPDDDASSTAGAVYRRGGEALLSYDPRPRIPRVIDPLVAQLHIASPAFALQSLPDRWLKAAVIVWR